MSMELGENGYDLDSSISRLITISEEYLDRKITESWNADERKKPEVIVTAEMRTNIERRLGSAKGRKVLRLTAPSNIVMGQVLEGVVNLFDSNLIFKEGEVLMREKIQGVKRHEDGANILYTMLKQVNRSAVSNGILPDPFSGTVGNLDSLDFYDVVDRIVAENDESTVTTVTIEAAADIYTEGPVSVRIEVEEEEGS
jgi:hypothetical protein